MRRASAVLAIVPAPHSVHHTPVTAADPAAALPSVMRDPGGRPPEADVDLVVTDVRCQERSRVAVLWLEAFRTAGHGVGEHPPGRGADSAPPPHRRQGR